MRQPTGRMGITGGTGFIGSCVADRMTTAGSDVVVLDTRPPQRSDVADVPVAERAEDLGAVGPGDA
jgi:nucleoside-diphosphate-sugar epimerase